MKRRPKAGPMPPELARFTESDWPPPPLEVDPAADAYVDIDRFYATHADRPDIVRRWAWVDAHVRWGEARIAWLKDHGLPWLETWTADLAERSQAPKPPPSPWVFTE
jgi:hypothetical protein